MLDKQSQIREKFENEQIEKKTPQTFRITLLPCYQNLQPTTIEFEP